jgi:cytochrome P450
MELRQNANCLPATCWALIELIKDKSLFAAIRAEITTALDVNGKLDVKKLAELPLLQSVYVETLRLHVAVNITRQITDEMVLDGYTLKKDYLVQTPSLIRTSMKASGLSPAILRVSSGLRGTLLT